MNWLLMLDGGLVRVGLGLRRWSRGVVDWRSHWLRWWRWGVVDVGRGDIARVVALVIRILLRRWWWWWLRLGFNKRRGRWRRTDEFLLLLLQDKLFLFEIPDCIAVNDAAKDVPVA
jgi:hypothetical protein